MGSSPVSSALLLLALAASGCGTVDKRVDPDAPDEVGGTGLQSQDLRTMADQMARDILESRVLESGDPDERIRFHIASLRNDGSEPIDKELVLTEIRTQLFRTLGRKVAILDTSPEALEEIRAQRAAKRAGAVDANPNLEGALLGSDFVLKGTIKERVQQSRSMRSVYHLVTFELTDLETSELRWTNSYQTKFVSEKSVINR
jgi:hypothetical protein